MVTREERRKLEAEWSTEDRSLLALARLIKGTVLMLLVLGLALVAGGQGSPNDAQYASTAKAASASGTAIRNGALEASQQVFDQRRVTWERNPDAAQRTASR